MKKTILAAALLAGSAFAALGAPRIWEQTSSTGVGIPPSSATDGVSISQATSLRVSVRATAGTVTGGTLCAYVYLPSADGGAAIGWVRNPGLDVSLTAGTQPDGGTLSAMAAPDLEVVGSYSRAAFVACGVTGSANDAGANEMITRTEAWGPANP